MALNTVLVTGAGRGIGLAISKALLANSYQVIMLDQHVIETEFNAEEKKNVTLWQADILDVQAIDQLRQAFEKSHGTISVLVNNAGISPKKSNGLSAGILEFSDEEWDRVIAINLTAPTRLCRLFLPAMMAQKYGRIINMSSQAARSSSSITGPSYMGSKAGLLGVTRGIASEMGQYGITANAIAPGRIDTQMARQASDELNAQIMQMTPVKRMADPVEVAAAVLFLCGPNSGFVNGAVIDVNGGLFMC